MPPPTRSPSILLIWQLTIFALLALTAYLTAFLFAAPVVLFAPEAAEVAMLLVASAALLGATWLVLQWFHQGPLRAIGIGFDRPWVRHTVGGFALGAVLIGIVWVAFQLAGWLQVAQRSQAGALWWHWGADFLLFYAVAAHEELLCRGYAFQVLYRRSKALAFLLPGLVFVALHWTNTGGTQPIAVCNLFLAHIFFGVCYLRTRSLWFPIGVHAGWNFAMADILGLPVSGNAPEASLLAGELAQNLLTGFSFGPEGGLLVTLALLAATFGIWRFVRQRHPAADLISGDETRIPSLVRESLLAPTPGLGTAETLAGQPPVAPEVVRSGSGAPLASASIPIAELTPALARPTQQTERVLAIDVLRGVAVVSILPMNMEIFALVPQAVIHPYAGLFTDSTNVIAWVGLRVFIGSIGLSLFSLLFGAGLLLFERAKGGCAKGFSHQRMAGGERGLPPHPGNPPLSPLSKGGGDGPLPRKGEGEESATALHYRRLAVLAVIGFAHAYFIWAGDILVTYAIVGSVVWLFRRRKPWTLVTLGSLSFAVPMLLLVAAHMMAPKLSGDSQSKLEAALLPSAQQIAKTDDAYRRGWAGQMEERFSDAVANQTLNLVVCMGWIAGGMMLMGMGLHKLGILTGQATRRTYWLMIALAAFLGYPLLAYAFIWCFQRDWQIPEGFFLGWAMRETAYPIIMMGWIGAVVLICRAGLLKGITSRLAATGQMALTNYLTQSILCHLIFYGTGLGLIDKVSIPMQIAITVAIWIVQLVYSPIWLAHYRFGPVEWFWRSLSYGRWFEFRTGTQPAMHPIMPALTDAELAANTVPRQ